MLGDFGGPSLEERGISTDGKDKLPFDRAMEKGLFEQLTFEEAMADYTGRSLQGQRNGLEALSNYQYFRARPAQAKYNDMYPVMDMKLRNLSDEELGNIIKALEESILEKSEPN